MIDTLLKRRADAERRYVDADAGIAEAVLEGDEKQLRKLRRARANAAEDADDAGEALTLAEMREQERQEAEAERIRLAALATCREIAAERLAVAEHIDKLLLELNAAVADHGGITLELSRVLRKAGLSDDGRMARMATPQLRHAVWESAPTFATLAELPRTPANRREPLAKSQCVTVPNLGDER